MKTGTFYFNTIDNAIDACPDNLTDWCKIIIPSGTYTLSRRTVVGDTISNSSGVLIAKNNLELVGAGIGKTILIRNINVPANLIVVFKKNNVVIRQMSLNASNISTAPKPIAIFNSTNVVIDSIEAYNGGVGIALMTATTQWGTSANIIIKNSIMHDNSAGGIHIACNCSLLPYNSQYHYNVTIQNNEMYNTNTKGIHVSAMHLGKIIGNKIHDNLIGISFDGNNFLNNPQTSPITSIFLVTVSNNTIYHNKDYGIRMIDNITNVTINNNLIFNNNQNQNPKVGGLYMWNFFPDSLPEATRYSTISGNRIFDNQSVKTQNVGIRVASYTELNSFIGNVISSTQTPWFVDSSLLNKNTFVNNVPQPT